jgi:flagellar basal-body rod modification protein FlgD
MNIIPISGAQIVQPQSDAEKATMNYNAFLKLMLEQLKSQDPTNPIDQTQSLAQLAAFSGVEQSIKINQKLENLMRHVAIGEAAAMIGKNVTSLTTGEGGQVVAIDIRADGTYAVLANGQKMAVTQDVRITGA